MNTKLVTRTALLLAVAASLLALPAQHAPAQTTTDEIEVLRGLLKADRKVVIADAMQLTDAEGNAFWPLYRDYRAEMEKIGDGIVKLVLEYADAYPDVPEDRAEKLLKDYLALEKDLVNVRAKHLKKITRALPASKVLRFAQLENRLDLALRLQMASVVPLTPIEGELTGSAAMAVATAEGVPGGSVVQTFELTATVAAVDQATRKLTLLSPDGVKQTVKVGPEAVNFDQIRVGDRLKVTVAEELAVSVAGESEPPNDGGAQVVALAPKGAKPGGLMAETIQVTAKVTALDLEHHKATLQFEDGTTRTVAVRPDVDLSKRKVGDKVIIRTTEMLAVSVSKP
jgi:Cu/Ag efflux protein CusF